MRQLKRDIRLKQAALLQERRLLAATAGALQQRALRALATPQVLAGSFAAGFTVALLRRPKRSATGPKIRNSRWLRLLLRDVVTPLILDMLPFRTATEQDRSPRTSFEDAP